VGVVDGAEPELEGEVEDALAPLAEPLAEVPTLLLPVALPVGAVVPGAVALGLPLTAGAIENVPLVAYTWLMSVTFTNSSV